MSTFILIVIFVIIVLNIFKAAAKRSQEIRTDYRDYAAAVLNLARSEDAELSGSVDGLSVKVWTEQPEGKRMMFCKAEYGMTLASSFQIVRGDFAIDGTGREFHIDGLTSESLHGIAEDSDFLQEFLSGSRRSTLKNCFGIYPEIKVTEQYLILGCSGITDGNELVSFIERTVSAAHILAKGKRHLSAPKRTDGVLPLPVLADDSPLQIQQNTPLPAKQQAVPIPVEAESSAVPVMQKITVNPVSAEIPEPVAEPVAEPTVEQPLETTDAEVFAKQLFEASFPGEKEKALFEQKKGQTVQWSGKLLNAYSFSSDFVFGKGPGTKASFLLCEISGAYGMKNRIKATVQFSPETEQLLHGKSGEMFAFSGTLLKMEPFGKEIFLTNGTLL